MEGLYNEYYIDEQYEDYVALNEPDLNVEGDMQWLEYDNFGEL